MKEMTGEEEDLMWYLERIEKELAKHYSPATNIMSIMSHVQCLTKKLMDSKRGLR